MSESEQEEQPLTRRVLARHPIAVDCARAAAAFSAAEAEVVVFDHGHVFVAAASNGHGAMLPRPAHAAEVAIRSAGSSADVTVLDGQTSIPIRGGTGSVVAALSIESDCSSVPVEGLSALARVVQTELAQDAERDDSFLHDIVHGQRDAVLVLTADLEIGWISAGIGSLLGRTPSEVIGKSAADYLHPDDIVTTIDAITRVSQGLEMYRVTVRLLSSSNEYIPVEVTGTDLSGNPTVGGVVLSLRDGQRDRESDLAMHRNRQVSNAIVGGLRDGVLATDQYGAVTTVNATARSMFSIEPSRSPAQLTHRDFALTTLDGHRHDVFGPDLDVDAVCCIVSERGAMRYVTTACQAIEDDDGSPLGSVVVFSDITREHHAAEELRTQALHDQLTGLANRRQLDQHLAELTNTASDMNVAACFVDLDAFKGINDTYGHRTGDQLVRIAARRIARQLRDGDVLVRQGGDEFVALLVGVDDLDAAAQVAERCRVALARPYTVGTDRFHLTGSIGVSMAHTSELDADRLLQHADLALYAAKDLGRNRVEVFDTALATAATNEDLQRRLLRDALDEQRLVMHFQPLINTATERTVGYEALARIRTHEGEILTPAAFLDAIAATSLVWDLDRAAFELSCQAAKMLSRIDADERPYVACNFSAVSVNHLDFIEYLDRTVTEAGIEPSQISIELTEGAAFESGTRGEAALEALGARGFQIALDDFGTGYSSLAHIRDLPISSIKVDRSFISNMAHSDSERSIAQAVVRLANDLSVDVVAEGVETSEQLDHAQQIGFSTIQGWYYSKALPLTDCLENWASTVARSHPAAIG